LSRHRRFSKVELFSSAASIFVIAAAVTVPTLTAKRLMPPQAAGMSCYCVAEEIASICAGFLVELRGFEPLTSAMRHRRALEARRELARAISRG
jgi:hypothetical protein